MKDFMIRIGSIEARWCDLNKSYELVHWFDGEISHCYVIAFFDKRKEGYDMRTVGNRFFEHPGAFEAAKIAMTILGDMEELSNES